MELNTCPQPFSRDKKKLIHAPKTLWPPDLSQGVLSCLCIVNILHNPATSEPGEKLISFYYADGAYTYIIYPMK